LKKQVGSTKKSKAKENFIFLPFYAINDEGESEESKSSTLRSRKDAGVSSYEKVK
jgi:hypothetical protein